MCELSAFARRMYLWEVSRAAMKAERLISVDSRGGALIYSYLLVFIALACILNASWKQLHVTDPWRTKWRITNQFNSFVGLKWAEDFDKPPFNIDPRLPAIVCTLWSIQPLIACYVRLGGIAAAMLWGKKGQDVDIQSIFLSSIQPVGFIKIYIFIYLFIFEKTWLNCWSSWRLKCERRLN